MPEITELEKNHSYVVENRDKLLELYRNKFVLIYQQEVVGTYDSYKNAAEDGVRTYGIEGKFLIHQMLEDEPANFVLDACL